MRLRNLLPVPSFADWSYFTIGSAKRHQHSPMFLGQMKGLEIDAQVLRLHHERLLLYNAN
jgi:hypothetical protein